MTDWSRYQKCPVCFAALGKPCQRLTGRNTDGTVSIYALEPHGGRRLRMTARPRPNGDR